MESKVEIVFWNTDKKTKPYTETTQKMQYLIEAPKEENREHGWEKIK